MKTLKFALLTLLFAMTIASCTKTDEPIGGNTPPVVVIPPKKDTTVVTPPNTPILPQTTIDSIKGKLLNLLSNHTVWGSNNCSGTFKDLGNNVLQFTSNVTAFSFSVNLNLLTNSTYNYSPAYGCTMKYNDGDSGIFSLTIKTNEVILDNGQTVLTQR
jgi:hypothetical protein